MNSAPPTPGGGSAPGGPLSPKSGSRRSQTAGVPWVLEPSRAHLAELLRAAEADPGERRRRGSAAHAAAQRLSWDRIAAHYQQRITALAARPPLLGGPAQPERFPLTEQVELRLLATPAWRGQDRLGELLAEWVATTTPGTSACLYLLADPGVDGSPEELEARILATGADIDAAADINVLMEPSRPDRDATLHAAVDAYVPLHDACAGHERLARTVVQLGAGELRRLVADAHTKEMV